MKKVLIMGSTGSIGTQALEIIRNNNDKFKAAGLTCRSRVDSLIEQIKEFAPEAVSVGTAEDAARVQREFPGLAMIEFTVDHMTGKEALELVKKREQFGE